MESCTYAAYPVILVIILWFLDHVPSDNIGISVFVLLICDEVDLLEQFLLVIFEFSHHLDCPA